MVRFGWRSIIWKLEKVTFPRTERDTGEINVIIVLKNVSVRLNITATLAIEILQVQCLNVVVGLVLVMVKEKHKSGYNDVRIAIDRSFS